MADFTKDLKKILREAGVPLRDREKTIMSYGIVQ